MIIKTKKDVQWNLSNLNLLRTNFCVWNRQVFTLYRLNKQWFSTLGLYLKFDIHSNLFIQSSVYTCFTVLWKPLQQSFRQQYLLCFRVVPVKKSQPVDLSALKKKKKEKKKKKKQIDVTWTLLKKKIILNLLLTISVM